MRTDVLILGLAMAVQALPAQLPAPEPPEQPYKLSVTAELVLLDVSVKDAAGEHIPNLRKDDFRIYENGKLQNLTHFASDDVPVTVGIVVDTSGSMRPKHREVVTAALAFIEASNPKDEVFVVNFGDRVSHGLPDGVPFSADLGQLRAALSLGVPAGRTALYDAIMFSLHHIEKGQCEKKALMLVSDGGDNSSTHGSPEVMRAVRGSFTTIYTIGIYDENDGDQNPALLRSLAQESGGEAFLPKQLSEVTGICRQIARDIRTRYTIGYVPVRSGEQGAMRKLRVSASAPGAHKLVINTRRSYFLPDRRPEVERHGEASRKRGS